MEAPFDGLLTLVIQGFSPVDIFVAVSPPKKYLSNVIQRNDSELHTVLRYTSVSEFMAEFGVPVS